MSKAGQELAQLDSFKSKIVEVDDAATALDRLGPEQDAPTVGEDGEARFGTPEAIATAIVASVVLGPVGGILVGGAQGWLKKRSDQAMLDKIASEQNILTESADIYTQQLDSFKAAATNDNDLQQIGFMRAGLTAAQKFMASPDEGMRIQGVDMMDKVDTAMQTFSRTQETQQIAADALDAQLGIELTERQKADYTGLQTDFDNQSAGYLARQQAGSMVLEALQNGNPTDIHTALILFNKLLDPNSAVLTAEKDALANMGSLTTKLSAMIEGLAQGNGMTVKQRRAMGQTVERLLGQSQSFQESVEARFSNRVADFELPLRFHDNFNLSGTTPQAKPLDLPLSIEEKMNILDEQAQAKQLQGIKGGAAAIDSALESGVGAFNELADNVKKGIPGAIESAEKFFTEFNTAAGGGARGDRQTN